MSNWSRIIMSWSECEDKPETDQRVARICGGAGLFHLSTIYSCPIPESDARSCMHTVVCEKNHLPPQDLLDAVQEESWEYPEDLEVLWRDEEADTFSYWRGGM